MREHDAKDDILCIDITFTVVRNCPSRRRSGRRDGERQVLEWWGAKNLSLKFVACQRRQIVNTPVSSDGGRDVVTIESIAGLLRKDNMEIEVETIEGLSVVGRNSAEDVGAPNMSICNVRWTAIGNRPRSDGVNRLQDGRVTWDVSVGKRHASGVAKAQDGEAVVCEGWVLPDVVKMMDPLGSFSTDLSLAAEDVTNSVELIHLGDLAGIRVLDHLKGDRAFP
mmetsp:Transcript_4230/g.6452  ORF Transcript_4230/g.6452 Transcript_4230/m.6452 type:complete len:223 (-) Transcript_4230:239-907(-)